jgi:2'-5' RNA ligase
MRLFVALDIPDEVRDKLSSVCTQLKSSCPDARWARPDGFHITLKFLGHVENQKDPHKLDSIVSALTNATSASEEASPIQISFRGLGFFPNDHRPSVLWCGVEGSTNLADLASRIERACEPLGFPPESRPYSPHLTLARLGPQTRCPGLVSATSSYRQQSFGEAREANFHLFESFTKSSGAEYKRLHTFPFTKEAP